MLTDVETHVRFVVPGKPIAKPRMTRADKWQQRPIVMRYWEYKDRIRNVVGNTPPASRVDIIAYLPIPQSWSRIKKKEMAGQPHRQTPDWDNIAKAVQDALWDEDKTVHAGSCVKFWDDGKGARTVIELET